MIFIEVDNLARAELRIFEQWFWYKSKNNNSIIDIVKKLSKYFQIKVYFL